MNRARQIDADLRFQQALGLTLAEADLFPDVASMALPADFAGRMRSGVDLALAVNTEKARSEFIIAPVLLELWRALAGSFGLFSGVEFDVDPETHLPRNIQLRVTVPDGFPEKYRASLLRAIEGCKVKKVLAHAPVLEVLFDGEP